MLCIKNKGYLAVFRCIYIRIFRCDYRTVSHHFLGKSLIRCSDKICRCTTDRTGNHNSFHNLLSCFLFWSFFFLYLWFCCRCFQCIRCCFQIIFQIRLDHSDVRTVNNLYTLSLVYHSGCTCCFQNSVIYQSCILYCTTKSCGTAIHITDVFLATQPSGDCFTDRICSGLCILTLLCFFAGIYISLCIKLSLCVIILTTRCLEIKLFNHEFENKVI